MIDLKVGDRVRLKGSATFGGCSFNVNNEKAMVLNPSHPSGQIMVHCENRKTDLFVHPFQIKSRFKKRKLHLTESKDIWIRPPFNDENDMMIAHTKRDASKFKKLGFKKIKYWSV